MRIASVIQVGPCGSFPVNLREAARTAFPEAGWMAAATLAELPEAGPDGESPESGGLLLFSMDSPEAKQSQEALDAEQLPRWAVVKFGGGDGAGSDALPSENWPLPQLAHALRSAAARHAEARENARLRGNLMTLARRVSHDLRTPLGGVMATVDMLAEITPDGTAMVKPLFSSVDEITKIINRTSFLLKAIAQPQPKKIIRMGDVVQEAVMRLERPITRSQATLSRPPEWPQVSGVESWLEIIWWNLLHNALHHAGPSPAIELAWDRLESGHRFHVRDHGTGIPPAAGSALFRPFHLLHDPNAPRGLGLPIVHTLVSMQGGQCGYEPLPDGGSGFYFTLPD
ncbi:MAG: HAMP domain-containing sensor histidine kinase [Verrucomicrobiota bacterium]